MYAMALSHLGAMSIEEFFQLTPRELDTAIHYKNKTEESKLRVVLEALRLQTYWDVNKNRKRGERRTRKEILMRFPWDNEAPKRRFQTAEEMKKMMKSIARSYNKGDLKRRTSSRKLVKGKPDNKNK
jgi:hypothetical protein